MGEYQVGPTRRAFTNARSAAKRRGLTWDIDFYAWRECWIASGHWEQRGKHRGQYQMDRIRNAEGYTIENIQIIPGAINRTKDSPHGWAPKLTESAVMEIRETFKKGTRGWDFFADKYGVSVATIKAVRTGRNWPLPLVYQ